MKTCPVCKSKAFDTASTCFECLYSFKEGLALEPKRAQRLQHQNLETESSEALDARLAAEEDLLADKRHNPEECVTADEDLDTDDLSLEEIISKQMGSGALTAQEHELERGEDENGSKEARSIMHAHTDEESARASEKETLVVEFWDRGVLKRIYRAASGSLYVGSEPYNDIFLPTKRLARRQLHLYYKDGLVVAEILDPKYPIYVNGKELEGEVTLSKKDVLSFGDIRLTLREKNPSVL